MVCCVKEEEEGEGEGGKREGEYECVVVGDDVRIHCVCDLGEGDGVKRRRKRYVEEQVLNQNEDVLRMLKRDEEDDWLDQN